MRLSSAALPALAATLASLAACHPMTMAVDPALSDDRMKVSRGGFLGGGDVAFGEFSTTDFDRSWTSSESTTIGHREDTYADQKYRFTFGAGGVLTDRVHCQTVYAEHAADFGRLRLDDGRHGLGCSLTTADGRPRGELLMTEQDRHRLAGTMIRDDIRVELVPSRRFEGGRVETFAPIGYDLRVDGHTVGAVQTINGGAVWIDRSAPPALRDAAAVAAATLLLYEELDS